MNKNSVRKKESELYGTGKPPYIEIYADIAVNSTSKEFETYFELYNKYFRISVTSPEKGKFATIFEDITERKQSELKMEHNQKLLDAINKVFQEYLTAETVNEVVQKCLEVAEELTESEFGFFGEINENGRLDDRALSPPAWDVCETPQAHELLKNMEIVSYWGRTIKEEKSQIVNES